MISFPCSHCDKPIRIKDDFGGKKGKCPACGKLVTVPMARANLAEVSPESGRRSLASGPVSQVERTLPPKAPREDELTLLPIGPMGGQRAGDSSVNETLGGGANKGNDKYPAELTSFLAPAQAPGEIGRLGSYRVLAVLGYGGMGVVFRAEDPHLERMVALKAMLPSMASSPGAKERFFREAKAAAALKHPHIVTIFQVGEDRGAPFLAMEFLEGEPLDERLKRETKLSVPEVLRIGREVAEGLEAAHEKDLIHRDIKPANLWLEGKKGHVKILDFGLARALGDQSHLTQSGAIIGTPAYMAPEQAGGKQLDSRCDLFSLGCVLYRMCTGELPFKGNDTISILSALALDTPASPVSLNQRVPGKLSDLVMQLLAKKAEERPESARRVAETLQQIEGQAGALPASAERKTGKLKGGGTKRKSAKRRSHLPWLVGSSVVGLGVVAAAILLLWPTPRGIVRIESDEPGVEIVFDKSGPTIKGADREPISLRAGEHGVLIKRGDFAFEADKFVLKKGQTITLKLEMLPGKVQVKADGRVIGRGDLPAVAAVSVNPGRVPVGQEPVAAPPLKTQTETPPPTSTTPVVQAKPVKDAVLHMTFEKDTFYEKGGKTYVRDLSGKGNDGLCEAFAFTPDGKIGGGLKCGGKGYLEIPTSLFNRQANYTLTAWMRVTKGGPFIREDNRHNLGEVTYHVTLTDGGVLFCGAWNRMAKDSWKRAHKVGIFPDRTGEWFFFSAALEDGSVDKGSLRIIVDEKEYRFPFQIEDTPLDLSLRIAEGFEAVVDEVAVFHRFLSVAEVAAIRQQGLGSKP